MDLIPYEAPASQGMAFPALLLIPIAAILTLLFVMAFVHRSRTRGDDPTKLRWTAIALSAVALISMVFVVVAPGSAGGVGGAVYAKAEQIESARADWRSEVAASLNGAYSLKLSESDVDSLGYPLTIPESSTLSYGPPVSVQTGATASDISLLVLGVESGKARLFEQVGTEFREVQQER